MDQGSGSGLHIKSHRARIEIKGEDGVVKIVYEALKPEIESPPNPERVSVEAYYDEGKLTIEIISRDIASLRAAMNSYIYLAYAAIKSLEKIGKNATG